MLTDEQIKAIAAEARRKIFHSDEPITGNGPLVFARAIEAAVRAEYGNVEPEKWKALYATVHRANRRYSAWTKGCQMAHLLEATNAIDGGTYSKELAGDQQ